MQKLVESWVEAERTGYKNNLTKAVEELNRECGTMLSVSRVGEYRRGKYVPNARVISWMLYRVLPWALIQIGHRASDPQLDALEDFLYTIDVAPNGERNIRLQERHPALTPRTPGLPPVTAAAAGNAPDARQGYG